MDPVTKNLRALQGALEHSLTIQRARVQEIVDDLVSRGTLSRNDADGLLGQLLASSKDYSQALLQVLDSITSETRRTIGAGMAPVIAPVMATAGKIADTVMKAPALATKKPVRKPAAKPAKKPTTKAKAPTAVSSPAADPIPGLSSMTVAEIKPKLTALNASALRRVRERELAGKARKTVLGQIDQLLGAKS